jgi:hypothetical protein
VKDIEGLFGEEVVQDQIPDSVLSFTTPNRIERCQKFQALQNIQLELFTSIVIAVCDLVSDFWIIVFGVGDGPHFPAPAWKITYSVKSLCLSAVCRFVEPQFLKVSVENFGRPARSDFQSCTDAAEVTSFSFIGLGSLSSFASITIFCGRVEPVTLVESCFSVEVR